MAQAAMSRGRTRQYLEILVIIVAIGVFLLGHVRVQVQMMPSDAEVVIVPRLRLIWLLVGPIEVDSRAVRAYQETCAGPP